MLIIVKASRVGTTAYRKNRKEESFLRKDKASGDSALSMMGSYGLRNIAKMSVGFFDEE